MSADTLSQPADTSEAGELIAAARHAVEAAETYGTLVRAAVGDRVADNGALRGRMLTRFQRQVHGLAWIETTIRVLAVTLTGPSASRRNELLARLTECRIASGRLNSLEDVLAHPQLNSRRADLAATDEELAALPVRGALAETGAVPALDAHGAALRADFSPLQKRTEARA